MITLTTFLSMLAAAIPAVPVSQELGRDIRLSDGKITMTAPKKWKPTKPANRIIEFEYAAPAVEGDDNNVRITMMGAGGTIDANLNRWMSQFDQPDGKPTKDRTKVEKKQLAGQEVHIVDITGIFKDKPGGPFSRDPTVMRPEYRMLSAIIVTKKRGQYFIKLYGPKKTVAANEKAFNELLGTLKVN